MCYTISAKTSKDGLGKRFKATIKDNEVIVPHFYLNSFNHPKTAIISSVQSDLIQTFYWGLAPNFCI